MRYFPRNGWNGNSLNRLLYMDIKTYLVELLMKQDQMSMAASIESRVPFLDHKVVEFAASLPARYKLRFSSGKYLLRKAMARDLPPEVLRRNKKGFPTPIRPWLRNQLFERLSAVLTDGRMAERRLIERSEEHTSELQSRLHLVCRLLLENKKNIKKKVTLLTQDELACARWSTNRWSSFYRSMAQCSTIRLVEDLATTRYQVSSPRPRVRR